MSVSSGKTKKPPGIKEFSLVNILHDEMQKINKGNEKSIFLNIKFTTNCTNVPAVNPAYHQTLYIHSVYFMSHIIFYSAKRKNICLIE